MNRLLILVTLIGLTASMVGCSPDEEASKQLTPDQQRAIMQQTAESNPNMPPEARAAQQAMQQRGAGQSAAKKGDSH